jgi:hypothetical protein
MDVIAQSIRQSSFLLVAICALACLAFLVSALFSLRGWRRASFRKERQDAVNRTVEFLLRAGLCALAGGAIWFSSGLLAPRSTAVAQRPLGATATPFTIVIRPIPTADVRQAMATAQAVADATAAVPPTDTLALPTPSLNEALLVTVTATPLATPTTLPTLAPLAPLPAAPVDTPAPTPTPLAIDNARVTATPNPGVRATTNAGLAIVPLATPTLAPTETPAAAAQSPAISTDCSTPDARLYRPAAGEAVVGNYNIVGDAIFGQGSYRLDILPVNETAWRFLWIGYSKVQGETLMPPLFATNIFPNGNYLMRLTLITPAGDERLRCVVPFTIANP